MKCYELCSNDELYDGHDDDVFDADDKCSYDYLNYLTFEKLCDINYKRRC